MFEDTAATLGLLIAVLGLLCYQITGNPLFDAVASIAIGVVLILTAVWLAWESKGLLIGESASPAVRAAIKDILNADERIEVINEVVTLHMGPDFIVVTLSADFIDDMTSEEVEAAVTELNASIKRVDPRIRRVFLEAEKHGEHARARADVLPTSTTP